MRLIGRAAETVLAYGLAAGAWAVNLALYPPFLAYTAAMAPGARAWHDLIDALNAQTDETTNAPETAKETARQPSPFITSATGGEAA